MKKCTWCEKELTGDIDRKYCDDFCNKEARRNYSINGYCEKTIKLVLEKIGVTV